VEENANTRGVLAAGRAWRYTGDLGYKDEDGYILYNKRIKRMLITNGYNVYPGQIENVIDSCPEVAYSCVIGVKDPRRIQRIKAYIVLRDGVKGDDACKERIMNQLRDHIARYALPREIEFRSELPRTLVGKVAYRILEEEANRLEEEKQQKEMQKAEQQ
ncbi:MAG: AMP-dependent synthetase, partial [Clostridiales bacterium]|nr:AMP-dependent synthetase [Candidatus Blautia equi]